MVEMDRRMSTVVEKEREASVEQKQLMKKVKDLMEKALKEKNAELEGKTIAHNDELQKAFLDGHNFTKEYLRPLVRKYFFKAFMEGWTKALDKQEITADLVLWNEEKIPISINCLLVVLATTEGHANVEECNSMAVNPSSKIMLSLNGKVELNSRFGEELSYLNSDEVQAEFKSDGIQDQVYSSNEKPMDGSGPSTSKPKNTWT
nr:hypothetical protein CFP56_24730 [Quercus suber]